MTNMYDCLANMSRYTPYQWSSTTMTGHEQAVDLHGEGAGPSWSRTPSALTTT